MNHCLALSIGWITNRSSLLVLRSRKPERNMSSYPAHGIFSDKTTDRLLSRGHSISGTNHLLTGRGLLAACTHQESSFLTKQSICRLKKPTGNSFSQAFSLPPNWNGLLVEAECTVSGGYA